MKTSTSGTKTSLLERAPLPSPTEKLALTIQEAAQLSSLGRTSIYKAIREGQLISRKYGTRTVIMRADLTSFLTNLPVETKKARER
jgi:excisionase family DNA binding protein